MIILSGYGLYLIIQSKKNLGIILTILLIISGIFISINEAKNAKPLVNQEELSIISNLEPNSYTLVTSSYYAPWVLGYSKTKTITPGLFDYNKWDYETWQKFWNSDSEEAIKMLQDYKRPLYIFVGKNQNLDTTKFYNNCFNKILEQSNILIYKVEC